MSAVLKRTKYIVREEICQWRSGSIVPIVYNILCLSLLYDRC